MSFDDFGWDASIERLYRDVDQKSDMNVTFDIDSINSVDNVIQITVYRILREAVTNVYKHAKASRLYVTLHIQNKEIYLEIRDDGIGDTVRYKRKSFWYAVYEGKGKASEWKYGSCNRQYGNYFIVTIPIG